MESIWIMSCFDLLRWELFTPHPGAFRTEAEAQRYVAANDKEYIRCSYREVAIGKY